MEITSAGREELAAVWGIAQATSDLTDAGLTSDESQQLNQLLMKVLHASNDIPQADTRFDASTQTGV